MWNRPIVVKVKFPLVRTVKNMVTKHYVHHDVHYSKGHFTYHDNPDKEDSLPCLIRKMIPTPQQHHKVFPAFSQELHPVLNTHTPVRLYWNDSTQPEANDWAR